MYVLTMKQCYAWLSDKCSNTRAQPHTRFGHRRCAFTTYPHSLIALTCELAKIVGTYESLEASHLITLFWPHIAYSQKWCVSLFLCVSLRKVTYQASRSQFYRSVRVYVILDVSNTQTRKQIRLSISHTETRADKLRTGKPRKSPYADSP